MVVVGNGGYWQEDALLSLPWAFVVLWHSTNVLLVWRGTQPVGWVHIYAVFGPDAQWLQRLGVLGMQFGKEEADVD